MGTVIFIIALVVEIAFATYCILTKSTQGKVRSFVRIGALAAFVISTLVSVIQWSFRWYALAALLLIWAVLGAWALMRKKDEQREYKTGRIVFQAIMMLLIVVVAVTPALIFPQHEQPKMTGKYEVATVNYTYTDASRIETLTNTGENSKVNVEFWYPKDTKGTFPLVVFDHGILGIKTSNTSTFMELASNGYVVCSIDHPYRSLFTVDTNGHRAIIDRSFLQGYMNAANGKYDGATEFKLEHEWMSLRIADINFVLDTVLAQVKDPSSDKLYQLIDPAKIGLMGHSLGGESSAQMARQRNDINAVVNLDTDLAGEYLDYVDGKNVLNDKIYPVPILNVLSDSLERLIAAVPDANNVVAVKHVTATAPNAFEVHLAGTDHMSFTDLPLISPFLVSMINAAVPKAGGQEVDPLATIEKMNNIVLKFFNAYLKGEGNFATTSTN
jgi:dienelactone hydrolase